MRIALKIIGYTFHAQYVCKLSLHVSYIYFS